MRLEIMSIEFYALNYPREGVLRAPHGCTGSRGPRLGPGPHGEVGDHAY